jgi:hypothetical protein
VDGRVPTRQRLGQRGRVSAPNAMPNFPYTNTPSPKTNPLVAITFHFTAYIASTDATFF